MLTARENMIETIEGGKPDRIVNQYEGIALLFHPFLFRSPLVPKGTEVKDAIPNAWGVYNAFPANTPGGFPVQDEEHVLVKDIDHWQDYVKVPDTNFTDEEWGKCKEMYDAVGDKAMKATFVAPGLFEQCYHMCKIDDTLMAMYESPDELHDMIKMLTEFELRLAEGICDHLHPEAIFHHSDSYAATLVPDMIEMGINVWQGCFSTNDIPKLLKETQGKITFMGGIENHLVDFDGWTEENNEAVIRKTLEEDGSKYFIPCIAQGGPGSVYPGVYKSMSDIIDKINTEKYGFTQEQLEAAREPIQIMF